MYIHPVKDELLYIHSKKSQFCKKQKKITPYVVCHTASKQQGRKRFCRDAAPSKSDLVDAFNNPSHIDNQGHLLAY